MKGNEDEIIPDAWVWKNVQKFAAKPGVITKARHSHRAHVRSKTMEPRLAACANHNWSKHKWVTVTRQLWERNFLIWHRHNVCVTEQRWQLILLTRKDFQNFDSCFRLFGLQRHFNYPAYIRSSKCACVQFVYKWRPTWCAWRPGVVSHYFHVRKEI